MTQEPTAGRKLDALVAERVMGQKRTGDCGLDDPDCPGRYEPMIGRWPCLPPYSTYIEAAWALVEKYRLIVAPYGQDQWTCFEEGMIFRQGPEFASSSASEAICKCALAVVSRENAHT